ncbi:MAG: T9SS type A sorting domain-containing protein [Chitinophagaceae bacterium]
MMQYTIFREANIPTPPQLRPAEITSMITAAGLQQNTSNKNAKVAGVNSMTSEQSLLVAALARAYGRDTNYVAAAQMLEGYGLYSDALPFYIQARMWADANRVLALLPATTVAEQQNNWLNAKAITLLSNKQSWKNLSDADRASVAAIANTGTPSPAVYMARGILANIDINYQFKWPVPIGPDVPQSQVATKKAALAINNQLNQNGFSLYPNPTTGSFSLNSNDAGQLALYTIEGLKVTQYAVKTGKNEYALPATLASGVYIGKFQGAKTRAEKSIRIIYQP